MKNNLEKISNSTFTALRVAFCWAALFAVFSFASADVVSYDTLDNYFYNDIQYHDTAFDAYYEQYKSENEFFYTCEWEKSGTTFVQIFFTNYNGLTCSSFMSRQNAVYTMAYGGSVLYLYNLNSVPVGARVYCISAAKNSDSHCASYAYTTDVSYSTSNYDGYSGIYSNYNFSREYGSNSYFENPSSPIFKYIKGDFNFYYNYSNHILENNFTSYIDDSRLQFSTFQSQLGNDILHIELSQFINNGFNISNTTLNELSFVIEYTNKTTGNISEITYTYDNDSEYFHEFSSNNFIERIYLNIPYYEFSGYDLTKNSFPEYSDVRIVSAALNLDYYTSGSVSSTNITEYISIDYYLQHEYTEIVPGNVTNPSYENTVIYDDTVINNMKTALHNKTSQYSFISGDWIFVDENSLPTFESWANVFTNYVWFADANSDTTYNGHWWQMANNLPSTADLTRPFDPSEFIELNKTWSFYDIVLLKVWRVTVSNVASVPVLQSYDLAGYLILISDRYYQHYEVENQLGIIEIMQNNATNSVAFYDSVRKRIDDFETQSLKAISGEDNSIFSYINDLDSDLNTGISRIVDSLPATFDDSSILDKLDDILSALTGSIEENEIDTPQECVQFYLDNENSDLDDISLTMRPAFFEGATLVFLYSLVSEGSEENVNRASMRDGGSNSSFNILWKLYNIIRSVYRNSAAGETITFVLDDMGDSNSYYNALFRSDFDPNDWGYLYE